jgi:hypothetical protein
VYSNTSPPGIHDDLDVAEIVQRTVQGWCRRRGRRWSLRTRAS